MNFLGHGAVYFTLGYSQIIPNGLIDLWLTMFSQMSGACIFAVFIGNAINLMEEMDLTNDAYQMKITQVSQYGFGWSWSRENS